jgi:hypothetical protein
VSGLSVFKCRTLIKLSIQTFEINELNTLVEIQ